MLADPTISQPRMILSVDTSPEYVHIRVSETPNVSDWEQEAMATEVAKHTPGPWAVLPQNLAGPMIVHEFETGKQMNPTGYRLIAHMLQRGNSLEADKANARLIAAAPDLLAACNEAFDFLGGVDGASEIRSVLLTAIAKATAA